MGIPNEHQLKFNSIKDAKSLLQAIEKRFGGNAATKKTQRNLLKQQYENFAESSSKVLDQTFDRLQKLIIQLKIHDVKGTSSSNTNTQNIAFVSSNSTSNTNGAVNTAHGVSAASSQVNTVNSLNIDNLSDAVICAFLTSQPNSPQLVECYNFHKRGHFAKECRAPRAQDNRKRESTKRTVPVETPASSTLVSCDGLGGYDWSEQAEDGPTNFALMAHSTSKVAVTELSRKLELAQKQKDEIQLTFENFENSSKSLIKLLDSQIANKCKAGLGYNAVPPPYTGNFLPLKPDLSGLQEFVNESIVSEPTVKKPVLETSEAKASAEKPKDVRKNFSLPLIEDWISNSKDEAESRPKIEKKTVKPNFTKIDIVKSKDQVKSPRKTIVKQVEKPRQHTHKPRGNQKD
nr:ribonuclease H-like domain-containing protein [Tanacetum cinerariifolium]